jgi:hypothetical protein
MFLQEQGAKATIQNAEGKTPLDFCRQSIRNEPKIAKGTKPKKGSTLDKLMNTKELLTAKDEADKR